jgi:precorrin-6B C5,15-methyltransferase / cobalt-precorrin-6B C5,C15-methyltransferase
MATSPLSQQPNQAAVSQWLAIVGVGAEGVSSLGMRARAAIESSELVVGSARHLRLVEPHLRGATLVWPSPMSAGIEAVLARRGKPTCIVATGDPFFFGIGASLAPYLTRHEFICYPAPSSISLAASALGWPMQDTDVVSLHGRELSEMLRYIQPRRRIVALSWDRDTPRRVAALLAARGFGSSVIHVLECLGAREERIRSCRAIEFDLNEIADLNIVAVELEADAAAVVIPVRSSLPDHMFDTDGQLTKQDVRAVTLSALSPRPGERLWDIGAGSGSISIEWTLSHSSCRAVAVEQDPQRCDRIRKNASQLGAPQLEIVQAVAPDRLETLPKPDAIFIGGGAGDPDVVEVCWKSLPLQGRLVVNAVSLESEALLVGSRASYGGDLRRIAVDVAAPLGSMTGWRRAMPVTQWRVVKS